MLIIIGLLIKVTQSGPNEMKFSGTVQFNLSFQMVLSVFDLVEKKYQMKVDPFFQKNREKKS